MKRFDSVNLLTGISLITLIVIVSFIFYFFLSNQSLRLDESQSIWQVSHTYPRVLTIIGEDVHVPLYHTLLHVWISIFGNSVLSARMMSFILFLLSIPILYHLVHFIYQRKGIALFTTFLFALSPFLNWYGSEVRMYSLFVFITLLNQYFYLRFLKTGDKVGYIGYIITSILGVYTHYFFNISLFIHALFYFINRKSFKEGSLKKLIIAAVIIALSFLPWIFHVLSLGSASNTKPLLSAPTSVDLFNTFSSYLFGFQEDKINTIILSAWPILVVLSFLYLRKREPERRKETLFFLLMAFMPILVVFFFSRFIRPFYLSRYLVFTLPSLYIIITLLLSKFSNRVRNLLSILLVLGILAGFYLEMVNFYTPVKENYKEAAEYINARVGVEDAVVLSAPFTIYPFEYYYRGPTQVYTLPLWERSESGVIPPYSPEKLPEEVAKLRKGHQKIYLLLSYDQGYEEDLRLYFEQRFHRLDYRTFSPGLTLYVYQLNYDTLVNPKELSQN